MMHDSVNVKHVQHRICILGETRSEDNNLEMFSHALHELVDTRSLDDIDIMKNAINLDGHNKISLMDDLVN